MAEASPREAVLSLLSERAPGATICPSEVARTIDAGAWREAMPQVHRAVDRLVAEGRVALSWKGQPLSVREGPYRIARSGEGR